jgi:hypothetical protein
MMCTNENLAYLTAENLYSLCRADFASQDPEHVYFMQKVVIPFLIVFNFMCLTLFLWKFFQVEQEADENLRTWNIKIQPEGYVLLLLYK